MRYILASLLFCLMITARAQTVITGKIKNYDGKAKVYYSPLTTDPISPGYWNGNTLDPDAFGNFRISFKMKGFGTMTVTVAHLTYYFLCGENSKIKLTIDQAKATMPEHLKSNYTRYDHLVDSVKASATVSIEGDYAGINRFYNRNPRAFYVNKVDGSDLAHLIYHAPTPGKVKFIVDSLIQGELDELHKINTTGATEKGKFEMTPEIQTFMENEIRAFYGTTFLMGMSLKRYNQVVALLKDPTAPYTIYNPE